MRKVAVLVLCLLALSVVTLAQQSPSASGTISGAATCPATNCVQLLNTSGGVAAIDASGSFSGSFRAETSTDNVTWRTATVFDSSGGSASSISVAGRYSASLFGAKSFRVVGISFLSGSATVAISVSASSPQSQAVSGTFWQATQPVSGTFWQATQPVSASSLPLPTGAATESTQSANAASLSSIDTTTTALQNLLTTSTPVTGDIDDFGGSVAAYTGGKQTMSVNVAGTWGDELYLTCYFTTGSTGACYIYNPVNGILVSGNAITESGNYFIDTSNVTLVSVDGPTAFGTANITLAASYNPIMTRLATAQTTPTSTDNGLIVRNIPSGTQTVTTTAGAAATSANQATEITSLQLLDNLPSAAGLSTASAWGVGMFAAVSTLPPAYSVSEQNFLSMNGNGYLRTTGENDLTGYAKTQIYSPTTGFSASVKSGSTPADTADAQLIVGLSPASSLPGGLNTLGSVGINGYVQANSQWSSATALNATKDLVLGSASGTGAGFSNGLGVPAVLMHLMQTTTISGGAITFEVSYDLSNTIWTTIAADQVIDATSPTQALIPLPYTLQANTNKAFLILMRGATALRMKLSTAITGSGIVDPQTYLMPYQPITQLAAASTVTASQATAANFNAQVQGAGASGAAKAGNPVQGGGVFNTTQPTVTNGQTVESQMTARGAQIVATGVDSFSTNIAQIGAATIGTGLGVASTGTQRVALSTELTYSASTNLMTATAAGTGVFANICGSASTTIRIQRIRVSGTVATGAKYGDVVLKKTTAATTSGTATTLTNVPYDSTSAAATAVAKYYTVLGTPGGSTAFDTQIMFLPITGTPAATGTPLEFRWRDNDSEAPTLRGTAQCVELNFGTTTSTAPTMAVSFTWTEK